MIKLCTVTGLGLVLLMRTMVGGPLGVSRAQADESRVTLASLAGKFASRGGGRSVTFCFKAGFTAPEDCAVAQRVPFNLTGIAHMTRDAAGNGCSVATLTLRAAAVGPASSTLPATLSRTTNVFTTTSFDPATGSGTASFSLYLRGGCIGTVFNRRGAILMGTGTFSFTGSDSGNRIEVTAPSFNAVTSPFTAPGSVNYPWANLTFIRESD